MAKQPDLIKELTALGKELGGAVNQMRGSKEFKELEKEISTSVKAISSTLIRSLKAAGKSESAHRIKKQAARVAAAGAEVGKTEARKAQGAAVVKLRKVRAILRQMSRKSGRN